MIDRVGTRSGVERQVADLYDFSLDIARHDADLEFADSRLDAVIHYVLDENIFEMFVRPWEHYEYVVREQGGRRADPEQNSRALTAMQSALFTGETLLGGCLPAQSKHGTCYVTQWHRWELLERISQFLSVIDNGTDEGLRASMNELIEAKQKLLRGDVLPDARDPTDPLLDVDLAELEGQIGGNPDVLKRFRLVRQLAAKLAADRTLEPVQQVNRLLRANEDGRIDFVTSVALPREADWRDMRRHATRWHSRIRQEAVARAARHGSAQMKSERAIWNDAQSLALIEWTSRQLDPTEQRVVLVTGDVTVFDAYRREYEQDPSRRKSGAEPFLLRRPLQYSTLFSSGDGSLAKSRRTLFYSLQQIVELPLTPIRVAATDPNLPADVHDRRQSLTLNRIGAMDGRSSYFHDAWSAYGNEYAEGEIADVQLQIDALERILNGLSEDLVARRIGHDDRELHSRTRDLEPEDRIPQFRKFVENAVDRLIESAVDLWRPHAEASFRKAMREGTPAARRHVPLAVHLLGTDGNGSRLSKLLERIFANRVEHGFPQGSTRASTPHLVRDIHRWRGGCASCQRVAARGSLLPDRYQRVHVLHPARGDVRTRRGRGPLPISACQALSPRRTAAGEEPAGPRGSRTALRQGEGASAEERVACA